MQSIHITRAAASRRADTSSAICTCRHRRPGPQTHPPVVGVSVRRRPLLDARGRVSH